MKFLLRSRIFWGGLLLLGFGTAVLIGAVSSQLWREISEAQAKKQSLKIPSWAPLVESSQPAVVVITTEALVEQPSMDIPGPFRFYLPAPPEKQRGQGSGFIINEDGYVLTNQHVVDGAQQIKIQVGDDPREYMGKVIGADEGLDIALVQILHSESDPKIKKKWPYLPLGDSDQLRLGEAVMALGSPLGLAQSVNVGIVSQKHRGGIRPNGRDLFVELIQLQMPINPGNSGGPVLDDSGRVVGVSESILAVQGAGNAIAFCVPINIIKALIPSLLKGGIELSYLGIEPTDLTPDLAKKLGLPEDQKGAVVAQIYPNTPAKKAGLQVGDVVVEIDDIKGPDSFKLRQKTIYRGVGQIVNLKIYRQGKGLLEFKIKLEKRPGQIAQYRKSGGEQSSSFDISSIGIELGDTPEQLRKELKLAPKNHGAQVLAVAPRSVAQAAGLEPGDVIAKVDGVHINSAEQLKELIDKAPEGSTLLMLIWRGHNDRFVHLKKPNSR